MTRGRMASCFRIMVLMASVEVLALDAEWAEESVKFINDRRRLDGRQIEHTSSVGKLLDRYMTEGMPEVIGWFDYQALLALRVLSSHQLANGVTGGVAEIGVHHGKSFAALCLLNLDGEGFTGSGAVHRALAVDVFDDQLLNTDGSGEGDLEIFRATVRAWCGEDCLAPHRLTILQQDSSTLTAMHVIDQSGGVRPRIFSIDGSHTAEHTEADMRTAAGSICEGGIIMVDDYFAEGWPGVSEGVHAFMLSQRGAEEEDTGSGTPKRGEEELRGGSRREEEHRGSSSSARKLVPFFVGFNKVLFAAEDFSSGYQDALMARQHVIGDGTMKVKMQLMFRHPVVVLTEEVQCKKKTRGLLPGEQCPAGFRCA